MEYLMTEQDYSVPEFYEKFKDQLPQLVMVSQGYHGNLLHESYGREQILRLCTVSRENRIVARTTLGDQLQMLSIPVSYNSKLRVVNNHGQVGEKEVLLSDVLLKYELPINVVFTKHQAISRSGGTIFTESTTFELLEKFEQLYFLGNYVQHDICYPQILTIPMYLDELRFEQITGARGCSKSNWFKYVNSLADQCADLVYDPGFGRPEIAVYKEQHTYEELEYRFMAPREYATLAEYSRPEEQISVTPSRPNVALPTKNNERLTAEVKPVVNTAHKTPVCQTRTAGQYVTVITYKFVGNKSVQTSSASAVPVTKLSSSVVDTAVARKSQVSSCEVVAMQSLSVTSTPERSSNTTGKTAKSPPGNSLMITETDTASVFAELKCSDKPSTPFQLPAKLEAHAPTFTTTGFTARKGNKGFNKPIDVSRLTISEVGKYLLKLNLGRFVFKFQEHMVDGCVLKELDTKILKSEFGFSAVEAIRLVAFAREGHVPE